MIGVDLLLVGYRVIEFQKDDVVFVSNLFLESGISISIVDNKSYVRLDKIHQISELLESRVKFELSDARGIGGIVYNFRKSFGAMFALGFSLLLYLFLSDLVWDVRIEGELPDKGVFIEELADAGLDVGARWSKIKRSRLETDIVSASDTISWININRRGCVAYVSIMPKTSHDEDVKEGYNNVVAKSDAVIEEITVVRGVAVVKQGDSVKKGDVLISGVIPGEVGGGFCYAEGSVLGRVSGTVSSRVSSQRSERKEIGTSLFSMKINFFAFSLNIFKTYRNFNGEYAIIEENIPIYLFGDVRLPISLTKKRVIIYKDEAVTLTQNEMTDLARENISSELSKRLSSSELLHLGTEGYFIDGDYFMKTEFVCIEDIGKELNFEVDQR